MKIKSFSLLFLLSCFSFTSCSSSKTSPYPVDTFTAKDGTKFTFTFFKHASFAIETAGQYIYIDPVSKYADYATLPKADLILITHSHYDHLDSVAIQQLQKPTTKIFCDQISAESFDACTLMTPGATVQPWPNLQIEAVPAYNFTEGHTQFHPRERGDCGYILTLGKMRIYIAGDGENTEEMKALKDIDIAFLPVNQPYTMTVDQAIDAVKAMRPVIFYPYHYGEVDEKTDLNRLTDSLRDITEIRIRPME
ncbi:MAG: MBL fold metallo-hydrolase [Alistipes sp.]